MPVFTEEFANPEDAARAAVLLRKVGYDADVDPPGSNTVQLKGQQPVRFSRRQLGGIQADEAEAILSRAGYRLDPDPADPDSVRALKGQPPPTI